MSPRHRYRELLKEGSGHVMPGAYDALSARIAEQAGFQVITAGGFAAIGSMLAAPDIGQSNMRDFAEHYGRIASAVRVPVSVDADTGFGDVHNVTQMVRSFEAAGVAGIMLGDQTFPNRCGYLPGKTVVTTEEMIAKIRAAVATRRDPDLVIIARTDAYGEESLEVTIERCRLYLEAGADVAKPQGVDRPDDIRRVMDAVNCPFAATLSQATRRRELDIVDLQAMGVATISMPSLMLFAAAQAVRETLATLAQSRSLAGVEHKLLPLDDYNGIVGLDDAFKQETRFREDAASIVNRRSLTPAIYEETMEETP